VSWRAIHDTTPHSETLSRLSHLAERLFFRMLSQSDPWGRLPGSPAKIRARCLPTLDISNEELIDALVELVDVGRILIYPAAPNEELACQLVDFDEHQPKALLGKRGSSRFGPPPEEALADARRRMENARMGLPDRARLVVELHDSPRLVTPARDQTESRETEKEEGSPTAAASFAAGLPVEQPGIEGGELQAPPDELEALVASLKGTDEHTLAVLRSALHGQPEAVLARALESLETRRRNRTKKPLVSEARYLVAIIMRLREERAA
jgi:hypothetical protein